MKVYGSVKELIAMYSIGSKGKHDGEQLPGSVKACSSLRLVTYKCSICGDTSCHCVIPSNLTRVSSGS